MSHPDAPYSPEALALAVAVRQLRAEVADATATLTELAPLSLGAQLDEARSWARHGYEIGQRSCLWADHGVAPKWLTAGWEGNRFPACSHMEITGQLEEERSRLTRDRNEYADSVLAQAGEIEQLTARLTEALRIVHHRLGHRGEPAACGLDVCVTLRGDRG